MAKNKCPNWTCVLCAHSLLRKPLPHFCSEPTWNLSSRFQVIPTVLIPTVIASKKFSLIPPSPVLVSFLCARQSCVHVSVIMLHCCHDVFPNVSCTKLWAHVRFNIWAIPIPQCSAWSTQKMFHYRGLNWASSPKPLAPDLFSKAGAQESQWSPCSLLLPSTAHRPDVLAAEIYQEELLLGLSEPVCKLCAHSHSGNK